MSDSAYFPWAPIRSWSKVILHMDADAFFASVMQSAYPTLRGKPVIVGQERGLATAFSYEAKVTGVKRGMLSREIKRLCPNAVFVDSDFQLFQLYSKKMFDIARQYSPEMEIYSMDEGFLDIKGMRRPLALGYFEIGATIQRKVREEIGITVSVGISLTKSLAKLASDYRKPEGITMVPGRRIPDFLSKVPIGDVWGIGHQTSAYLTKMGIKTALDFANKPESFFLDGRLAKPYREIWHELRGQGIYNINTSEKESYSSISRTQTFSPATNNKQILLSKTIHHIEEAFEKARSLRYVVGKVHVFLKTSRFTYHTTEVSLYQKTNLPLLIRDELIAGFSRIYKEGVVYRAAGCTISDLQDDTVVQQGLFTQSTEKEAKLKKLYTLFDIPEGQRGRKVDFGSKLFDKDRMIKKKPERMLKIPFYNLS